MKENPYPVKSCSILASGGFAITEFLVASALLAAISAWLFSALMDLQRAASYRTEVESVLENTRMAMDTACRVLRQAGNDPLGLRFIPLTGCSATGIRVRSDLTGSAGPADPDKGDPDGDTEDSGEDILLRFNAAAGTMELVPANGAAQAIASQITRFSFRYWNASGDETYICEEARRITLTITASSAIADPRTGNRFGITVISDVRPPALP